jgi:hypothetical protein
MAAPSTVVRSCEFDEVVMYNTEFWELLYGEAKAKLAPYRKAQLFTAPFRENQSGFRPVSQASPRLLH